MHRILRILALLPLAACLEPRDEPQACVSAESDCLQGCANNCNLGPETPAFERQREIVGGDVFLWSFDCASCAHECQVQAELCEESPPGYIDVVP
jgi:hypothetical protein